VKVLLRPTTPVIIYSSHEEREKIDLRGTSEESQNNLKKERFTGGFSLGARSRCSRVGSFIVEQHKQRMARAQRSGNRALPTLVFVTLTYPKTTGISDQDSKRQHLNTFLQALRRRYPKAEYIWRTELTKTGRLHYHLLITSYIGREWLSATWNRILRAAFQLDDYYEKHGHYNAPSTNVQRARTSRGAVNYLCKYLLKQGPQGGARGRQWSSSLPYDDCKSLTWLAPPPDFYKFSCLRDTRQIQLYELEWCTLVNMPTYDFIKQHFPGILDDWLQWLEGSAE